MKKVAVVSSVAEQKTPELAEMQEIFLLALRELLPATKLLSDAQLEKKIGNERLQDAIFDVFGIIVAGAGEELSRSEKYALACQVLRCLSRYISTNMQMPVTLKTVIDTVSLSEHSLDQCYPGYLRAGLLAVIIKPGNLSKTA